MNSLVKQSIVAGGSFAGGLVAGYLLRIKKSELQSTYRSAKSLSSEFAQTVKIRGGKIADKGLERVKTIRTDISLNFKDPIPDLYKATESLTVDDLDLKLPR
ncbi:hypothetical protein [Rhodohalobacter barkolensis]|uniref:YtxH domain-containing protein n=1 Tax=Rhodohalobacter barkolensis TaxID=2053187 RepID=A0A2N0VHF4_9BACT|nr:hypothetical protein [Rhodohalobacter barkolensis]PKD43622.1 hypothetical protein CWD77_08630 [Rhodohalobacter barkolensis]